MSDNKHYPAKPDDNLDMFFGVLDNKNTHLNKLKKTDSDLWKTILFKLKVDWTYNSNSIEGSTFTKGDTIFFLNEGLTVKGKPLKDHLDTQNHADAIDFLFDLYCKQKRNLRKPYQRNKCLTIAWCEIYSSYDTRRKSHREESYTRSIQDTAKPRYYSKTEHCINMLSLYRYKKKWKCLFSG